MIWNMIKKVKAMAVSVEKKLRSIRVHSSWKLCKRVMRAVRIWQKTEISQDSVLMAKFL